MLTTLLIAGQLCLAGVPGDGSLEALCRDHPERVQGLFAALDLARPGLEGARDAADRGDWPGACGALLKYYEEGDTSAWLRVPRREPGDECVPAADAILDDTFTLYEVTAKVPRRSDGGLDWGYNGPEGDREWGWGLNRHPWAGALLDAYEKTGNAAYIARYDSLVRDWVASNPYPGKASSTPQWRGLEAFFRVVSWSEAFFGLQEVPEFTPAARILVLSSIPEHAHFARNFHAGGGNWITMELRGLATAAVCWPEFRESEAWLRYAADTLTRTMGKQVYPDGAQTELTCSYHYVALLNFEALMDVVEKAGQDVPANLRDGIQRMYDYLARVVRPSGYAPLNNDSDLDFRRPTLVAAAERFGRPDWAYIATNGKEGTKPEGLPSAVFPWAGQVVMRSGWNSDDQWAFFDIGPLGAGHWHLDKLHLSVSAGGRDVLVDSGRYTYVGGPWRGYFTRSAAHNLVLVDGAGQNLFAPVAAEPLEDCHALTPRYDYARGVFADGYVGVEGRAVHTRVVAYLRGRYWLVVDRLDTDRPRRVEALWHFHPDCTTVVEGESVASADEGKGNIRIVPLSDVPWEVDVVAGRGEPDIQGWWSRCYNEKVPSPCAVYSGSIEKTAVFAWLLLPGEGPVALPKQAAVVSADDSGVTLRVGLAGGPSEVIRVPFDSTTVDIQAE